MIFFVKQKTAYDMRISDWSSDVCSSDLQKGGWPRSSLTAFSWRCEVLSGRCRGCLAALPSRFLLDSAAIDSDDRTFYTTRGSLLVAVQRMVLMGFPRGAMGFPLGSGGRSEEHTSELQSLMRISYAVFCLKKKKNNNNT